MKNYYELLEVNKKASKEVIEKAYKVLAKKYHPDLSSNEKRQYSEQKIKEINEAYNVLSDEFLREQYDIELEKEEAKKIQNKYAEQHREKQKQKEKELEEQNEFEERMRKQKVGTLGAIVELTKKLVYDVVKNKDRRDEIKNVTKKDVFAIGLTLVVVILIGIILWFIPFTNTWMRQLLFENPIFNWIGSIFGK